MNPFRDAVIVGAGVSGTAAAILLARAGLSVMLVDARRHASEYKSLCTHFVQPVANHVFAALGADELLAAHCSVRTQARFVVPGGVIDSADGYGSDDIHKYAHNLERRVLDPTLRRIASELGVEMRFGTMVAKLCGEGETSEVHLDGEGAGTIRSRFVVAADGRNSDVARLLDAAVTSLPNDRAAYFVYGRGVPAPENNRSLFVLNNGEMSFLYPQIEGRTLLSVYVKSERVSEWGGGRTAVTKLCGQFSRHLPEIDFQAFQPESPVRGYKRYHNLLRSPVTAGVAFIGDAAVSLDPMSGVGCAFGLLSAEMLARAIVANHGEKAAALTAYASDHQSFFRPHVGGIVADARVAKSDEASRRIYDTVLADARLQQSYLALTARLITPAEFQKKYLLSAARRAPATRRSPIERTA